LKLRGAELSPKLGLEVVTEALRAYRGRRRSSMQKILDYAKVNRVDKKIRPYLEALS